MSASGSSSSVWPTACVPNGGRATPIGTLSSTGQTADGLKRQVDLNYAARMWPTPVAQDDNKSPDAHMAMKARMKGGPRNNITSLNVLVKAWPTPAALDGEKAPAQYAGGNPSLPGAAVQWSTPRATDGEKGGPNQSFGAGGEPLPSQAVHMAAYLDRNIWPTPTAMNRPRSDETIGKCLATRKANAGQNTVPLYLEDVASRLSLQAPETETDGAPSSPERRSLNPLFVEWLMGWPPGWTLLVSTDFGCSATEFARFKVRMRSALSALALHDAPPAQASLFG